MQVKEVPVLPVDTSPMRWKGTEKEVPKAKVNDMVIILTSNRVDRAHCEHLSLGFFSVKSDLTGPFLKKNKQLESVVYRKFPSLRDFI